MMKNHLIKKIIFLLCISQFFSLQISAQFFDYPFKVIDTANFIVIYKLTWRQDTNNLDRAKSEDMILFVGKKSSKFMSYNYYQFDFEGRKAEREGRLSEFLNEETIKSFGATINYSVYKNFPHNYCTYTQSVMPTLLAYEEPMDVYKWELIDLIDSIGNYIVHCAQTEYGGRNWIAWYTTDLPINDGPYKFSGLPGLIIRMYDDKKHYIFDMEKMERPAETLMIAFDEKDWVQTTRYDFLKAQENLRMDIINRAKDAGANNETQQRAYRNMMKRNNPIELK